MLSYINLFEKRMLFLDICYLGVKRSHELKSEIAYEFNLLITYFSDNVNFTGGMSVVCPNSITA